MNATERQLMLAMSAVVHLLEFVDTKEPNDLDAAMGILKNPELQKWYVKNTVLLPLRRDATPLNDRVWPDKYGKGPMGQSL